MANLTVPEQHILRLEEDVKNLKRDLGDWGDLILKLNHLMTNEVGYPHQNPRRIVVQTLLDRIKFLESAEASLHDRLQDLENKVNRTL